jgi:serpin B
MKMLITGRPRIFLILTLVLTLNACSISPAVLHLARPIEQAAFKPEPTIMPQVNPTSEGISTLSNGNQIFAVELFQAVSKANENLFLSPYSISLSLAMAGSGARGQTQSEIDQVLHLQLPQEMIPAAFNALNQSLAVGTSPTNSDSGQGEKFKLKIAAATWGQKGFQIRPAYLDLLHTYYGADLQSVDFKANPELARSAMNQWTSQSTQGKIKDMIAPGAIAPDTRMIITNAIYFQSAWLNPFDKNGTHDQTFTTSTGETITVPMMQQEAYFGYAKGSGWQAVELPYANDSFVMDLILPDQGQFQSFEQSLDAPLIDAITQKMDPSTVNISLPRFQINSGLALNHTLNQLGITQAFDLSNADFTGISAQEGLYLGNVLHRAYIQVDENGTEAAAASGISMPVTGGEPSIPVQVVFDHPFLFLVREKNTGTILFLGKMAKP